eukprot:CAMPEP_0202704310 /NCGR_PEP_ID=MMETSP1385-20130828/17002_1 /ASSEMBLY_ACC=CAM_ASM_000861 /TAXON_ID=933848 /ORGANISM="Elphidium margaritaceum" /LENGTH=49 /DNA_ID=CAMNT_0049362297 /DNA_START=71 /DNA_END=220 /DNA_ORIENTATION=-
MPKPMEAICHKTKPTIDSLKYPSSRSVSSPFPTKLCRCSAVSDEERFLM